MKKHVYQIINALAKLKLKNAKVEVVQFSGVESMVAQYEPGGNGSSRLFELDHYRVELNTRKLAQVSKKKLDKIKQLKHQSHLALCLQDIILDRVHMRELEGMTMQTTLLILTDTLFELQGLKNGLTIDQSNWSIDVLSQVSC